MRLPHTILTLLPLVLGVGHLWGQFTYEIEQTSIVPDGAFAIEAGALHYWTSAAGYRIYTPEPEGEQVVGFPFPTEPVGGWGIPFAVFDAEAGLFYAATYASSDLRYVSIYDTASASWLVDGPALSGLSDVYAAALYDGQLTVVGRAQPWNGEGPVEQYIFNFDDDPSGAGLARHDALIRTEDSLSVLAYGAAGELYYATAGSNSIYRWSAEQLASVTDDFDLVSTDEYLTLSSGEKLLDLPGRVGGLAVDDAGILFFTMNVVGESAESAEQMLAQYDSDLADGYEVLVSSVGELDSYGDVAIEGSFAAGGLLYFSPGVGQGLVQVGVSRYSASLDDDDNPYDAPIPGFVGPAGDGKVSVEGYEDELNEQNYVNPLFLAWADEWTDYSPASVLHGNGTSNVDSYWQFPEGTLGPVTGDNFDVASLGDQEQSAIDAGEPPGSLTIRFFEPIRNLSGADFAVFENGFISLFTTGAGSVSGEVWAELAYVEVSSNGLEFARFPSVSNTPGLVGAYGSLKAENIFNLAGKHCNAYGESWGTPFDLKYLEQDPLVQDGTVDLDAITHVRVVDIPGNGHFLDSLGQPIYDAWVTWGSGGADVEAFGAISQALTYDEWRQERILPQDDDGDADGWTNLQEYAFRLNPEVADGRDAIRFSAGQGGDYHITFPRDERNVSVRYLLEACTDLSNTSPDQWETLLVIEPMLEPEIITESQLALVESYHIETVSPQASVGVLQDVHVSINGALQPKAFFRVRLEQVE